MGIKMVHFRNTVIHHQQKDMSIVRAIIVSDLNDLIRFSDRIMELSNGPAS